MPRIFLLLVLALPFTAMAALPSEFAAACRAFHTENPKGWSFTQVTTAEGRTLVERYDASQPDFNRWSLLQQDSRPPTEAEASAYKEKFTRRSRGGQAPNIASQLDLASAEFVSETPERLVYRFRLKPEEDNDKTANFLRVSVTYHKPTGSIEVFELANLDPFSPVLGVKITELRTTLRYTLPQGDRPSLLDLVSTRTRGRAFFKSLDADRIVTYTDYAWAGKRQPPKR
jgi:hypothetical protein